MKILVAGLGQLGQHHVRILAKNGTVEVCALVDSDARLSESFGKKYGLPHFASVDAAPKPDAAVIVTPTPFHYPLAKKFLEEGVHCFVEKPFTATPAEADELIDLAAKKNLVLQVGHIERFNPAVVAAKPFITKPIFIEANRIGPFSPRVAHIGVIMDLMIHDIDILLYLVGEKVKDIEAYGARVLTDHEDMAKVRIRFEGGCVCDLSGSRVSLEKQRKIRIFQPDSYVSIDYAARSVKVYSKRVPEPKSFLDISVEKPKPPVYDQLERELEHFIECARHGKRPAVTGEHGRDALELVGEIYKIIRLQ
ncbi:MAG: UDP-N-acetyl-D-glucosamine dehydrogenase [Elusimicrobia bacterium HGW-Elusimicrobia-1]|jgi:predicted dehydrogenase|nr:MAG: UDP-N-acetyl-D-glucosamine dehydrogenase [Elusimicrobia bacterium HGW-Elusimicrobia-3]PKN01834.1 MAG: UDP-N-acetyl-D-glucosamine dehydrogenase [Elusimicrobia bacterium HGW-Elusimicrobia-1]